MRLQSDAAKTEMNGLKNNKQAGTTLIEVLVVMVVFLVGILAIAQVFPGGFRILNSSRDRSVADAYTKSLTAAIEGDSNLLPDAVLPVPMTAVNGGVIPLTRSPFDTSLFNESAATFNPDGTISYAGTNVGYYAYFEGPNVFDGVAGIPITIPANPSSAAILPYGPTFQTAAVNTNIALFSAPFVVIQAQPTVNVPQPGQVFLTNASNGNALLQIPILPNTGTTPNFALSASIYVMNGGVTTRMRLYQVMVPTATIGTVSNGYLNIPMSELAPTGTTFLSVDPESVAVQRQFDALPTPTTPFTPGDPYQYGVLNALMGTLQFNPAASTYRVLAANGEQMPLQALAYYTVLDWGILSDNVQLQLDQQTYRLSIPAVQVIGDLLADKVSYKGLELPNFGASATPVPSDIVFVDAQTGGLLMYNPTAQSDPTQSDFTVDKSAGWFQVNPALLTTGLQEYLPDPTTATGFSSTPTTVPVSGLQIKVYYRAKNNWMRQVLPAPSTFSQNTTLQNPTDYVVGNNTRIYFPPMMAGQKVSLDQVYYQNGSGYVQQIQGQSFLIRNQPADANGAYVDIRDYDPNATGFDFSHGFAVRGVHGISYIVQTLHNSTYFKIDPNPAISLSNFDSYRQGWVVDSTQTVVNRGEGR